MSGERVKSGRLFVRAPLETLAQIAQKTRRDLREFKRLARKARERIRATRGFRKKFAELGWILGRARNRIARRFRPGRASMPVVPPQRVREMARLAERTAFSASLTSDSVPPCCEHIGGGALSVSLDRPATEAAIYVRDEFLTLHHAQIEDRRELASETGESARTQLLVLVPPELAKAATVDVVTRTGDEELVFAGVRIGCAPSLVVTSFRFENSVVRFSGKRLRDSSENIVLGLFIDGSLGGTCTIDLADTPISGALAIDHSFFDGCAHLLELRELSGSLILAHVYEILPLYLTPWSALQQYARPPLDGALGPRARHHFRSFQLWFEQARAEGIGCVPPLDRLYAELSQGFRKRDSYPRIEFERSARPTVSIVIPARDKCEVTYYCLCALLFAFNSTHFEVVVVDDGSSDETLRLGDFVGGIDILRLETPLGFVGACNLGASRARGEFVLLLNNDTEVTARWLDELVAVFRNFDGIGLAGSKLVYPDGRLQEAGGVIWGSGNPWNVGRDGNPHDPRYSYLRKVDYVSGAALMMPRELWRELGGFSEEFSPGYFEDTDLAMKVRASGRHVVYAPTSTVYHFEGQTAGNSVTGGMKTFQEVNRPKFHAKWAHVFRDYGREGEELDREKDRDAAFRVLFIDHQFPFTDMDAGSYAAFQEVRLFQALGAKVTFLPRNLAWMDRHTVALQRIGVECLYAPYVMNFLDYVQSHAAEYELVYVNRYTIAEQVLPLVRAFAPQTRVAFNLADLHFLRELREAAANSPGYTRRRAGETRRAELAAIMASDLTFSYSDAELGLLEGIVRKGTQLAKMPWVVDCAARTTPFDETRDILFLGGFNHPPNLQAARFFAREVMPLIRGRLPDALFNIVGSGARARASELSSEHVRVLGYVPSIAEHLDRARVFVAPLLAGAGLKGKVLDAISYGVPCVLSPIAAEGTGLTDGLDCLIAETKEAWVEHVERLYSDEGLWSTISTNALKFAETRYSFAGGTAALETELARIGLGSRKDWGIACRRTRPAAGRM
jgi:GT2 family glycosyltransferase/glycosyltransferase involved in cell wall biosynthesis